MKKYLSMIVLALSLATSSAHAVKGGIGAGFFAGFDNLGTDGGWYINKYFALSGDTFFGVGYYQGLSNYVALSYQDFFATGMFYEIGAMAGATSGAFGYIGYNVGESGVGFQSRVGAIYTQAGGTGLVVSMGMIFFN